MGRGVLRRRLARQLLGRPCCGGHPRGGQTRACELVSIILEVGGGKVTYQIPAGGVAGVTKLVVGGENNEDLGCHFCKICRLNWVMLL
jgi:hypothetical protein